MYLMIAPNTSYHKEKLTISIKVYILKKKHIHI